MEGIKGPKVVGNCVTSCPSWSSSFGEDLIEEDQGTTTEVTEYFKENIRRQQNSPISVLFVSFANTSVSFVVSFSQLGNEPVREVKSKGDSKTSRKPKKGVKRMGGPHPFHPLHPC